MEKVKRYTLNNMETGYGEGYEEQEFSRDEVAFQMWDATNATGSQQICMYISLRMLLTWDIFHQAVKVTQDGSIDIAIKEKNTSGRQAIDLSLIHI